MRTSRHFDKVCIFLSRVPESELAHFRVTITRRGRVVEWAIGHTDPGTAPAVLALIDLLGGSEGFKNTAQAHRAVFYMVEALRAAKVGVLV